MRVSQISFGRTIKTAEYENFRLDMTMDLTEEDSDKEALATLVNKVDSACRKLVEYYNPSGE